MMDRSTRLRLYADIVQRLSGAVRAASLYSMTHPSVEDHVRALLDAMRAVHASEPTVLVGFIGGEIVADDTPLTATTSYRAELIRYMQALGINRVLVSRGVTLEEVGAFVRAVSQPAAPAGSGTGIGTGAEDADIDFLKLEHLRAGRIPVDTSAGHWGSSAVTMKQVYSGSIDAARMVWESTRVEGSPDVPAARETVEQLAEAVDTSPATMIGLTGMKAHDEYTFTHMVNVSILTMAQARSLGIEGDDLRTLGLSALLHDIGKVMTPLEVLNKPGTLTAAERAVINRHPADGAAILRATRDVPRLAAIVAFEHHLHRDGTGYPAGVRRETMNLGTELCGIADVYDALRSARVYKPASPSARIMEMMLHNDGGQFEPRLVRRFIDLMGVYPPSTIVRLTNGEVGVVVGTRGPDPALPEVKVLFDARGSRLEAPSVRQLWQRDDEHEPVGVQAALDPDEYDIDSVECA